MIEGRQGRVPTDILCRDHHSLQALLIDDQRMEGKCWNTQIASFLLTVCQSLPTLKTSLIHSDLLGSAGYFLCFSLSTPS
jgi:hypothetical protein